MLIKTPEEEASSIILVYVRGVDVVIGRHTNIFLYTGIEKNTGEATSLNPFIQLSYVRGKHGSVYLANIL